MPAEPVETNADPEDGPRPKSWALQLGLASWVLGFGCCTLSPVTINDSEPDFWSRQAEILGAFIVLGGLPAALAACAVDSGRKALEQRTSDWISAYGGIFMGGTYLVAICSLLGYVTWTSAQLP